MAIKTSEQITQEIIADESLGTWKQRIRAAVELDRQQRNLIEVLAEALDDREAHEAAQKVRDTDPDDDVWHNCYLGPLLDSLETDYLQ